MAKITLEGVTKRYRDAVAVEDLDLEIGSGQLFMLVGPSGCGKTTVIRLIAGLEQPDEGVVRFDGEDVTLVPPDERNVAMVFEGYALYPHLAVRDNLSFALRLRKTPRDELERRVSAVAEAMDLTQLLRRRPAGLAAGQAQSVAVGRAVVRDEPSVVLLDDALAHLDAEQRLEARAEVRRLQREHGYTVVSVTHDQAEALAVGTRVAVMNEGRIQQVGTPRALYEYPANTFVASFVGDPPMNLLRMLVQQRGEDVVLTSDALELPAPYAIDEAEGWLSVGFRPEAVRLTGDADAGEVTFRGRCELVEYLGSELLVHLRVGDAEIVAHDKVGVAISVGDEVACSLPLGSVHLFDGDSGRSLLRGVAEGA